MNSVDTKRAIQILVCYPMAFDTFKIADFAGDTHVFVDWSTNDSDVDASIENVKAAIPKGSEFCSEMAGLVMESLGLSGIAYDYLYTIVGRLLHGFEDYDDFITHVIYSLNVRYNMIKADLKALMDLK